MITQDCDSSERRNLEREIDELRDQVRELLTRITDASRPDAVAADHGQAQAFRLGERARSAGDSGAVRYYGTYQTAGQACYWSQDYVPVERLLRMDIVDVTKVLHAIASPQRLAMLQSILEQPRTVAELVGLLGCGTTGRAYHHLRALQGAGFVAPEEGGRYAFRPHRVQGLLTILAGVGDTLDRQFRTAQPRASATPDKGRDDGTQ